jgi:cytochrome c oxidase subunit II
VVPLLNNFSYYFKGPSGSSFYSFYEFDSVIESFDESDLPRLLGCSSDLFLPFNVSSRLLISSTDVIHSFSIPVLGLKVDAFPGRINQLYTSPNRLG